ncbi:MAG: helix-turn-helix domain-containing protein [Prevotella sp.]|nr:helix-turn-helix domain-containing protein [Prevotella sp.]
MKMMKQKYSVIVLFLLILASGATSFQSYQSTRSLVTRDMERALALTLKEQQSNVISADTIQLFNNNLLLEQLKGKAELAVDTRQQDFRCYAKCSAATVFSLSDQRPASILWAAAMLWGFYCFYRRRKDVSSAFKPVCCYGGLGLSEADGRFYDAEGNRVNLTPMQQQLMEMFFRVPSHRLTKTEICEALWPKKEDASETLYTLIRRLKSVVEQHSDLKIEVDRGRAYELKIK